MAGNTNFPTALDDDTSLHDVTDGTSTVQAAHHNNLKEAVKAIEAKLGIRNSSAPTTLDYRLGHPTAGHLHDGASGQGPPISASDIQVATGYPSGVQTLDQHLVAPHAGATRTVVVQSFIPGSAASGINRGFAFTWYPGDLAPAILEELNVHAREAPSGATTIIDVHFDATSIWFATQAQRIMLRPGATSVFKTNFNNPTYWGDLVRVDVDQVGSSAPGQDISLTFVFRMSE